MRPSDSKEQSHIERFNLITEVFHEFYNSAGAHRASYCGQDKDEEWDNVNLYFLLDKKHVIQYEILNERGSYRGGLALGIGPRYFSPADFWDYQNYERFTLEATAEGIRYNLALLDEFLGYDKAPDRFNPDDWRGT